MAWHTIQSATVQEPPHRSHCSGHVWETGYGWTQVHRNGEETLVGETPVNN